MPWTAFYIVKIGVLFMGIRHIVNQFFNHLLFNIYVKAEHADKCEFLQEILVFFFCIFIGITGHFVFADNIFCQRIDLLSLQAHDFLINFCQVHLPVLIEILFRERAEKYLDIADGQNVFKIVNKGQHQ